MRFFEFSDPKALQTIQSPDQSVTITCANFPEDVGREAGMMTRAFIVRAERLGAVIAWLEGRCLPGQISTIDVQSRVVVIECASALAADQVATRVGDRPGWRRKQDVWLFLEVLEPCEDIEAEFRLAQDVIGNCGLPGQCEVAKCWIVEVGFPSMAAEDEFREAARVGIFPADAADCEQISD